MDERKNLNIVANIYIVLGVLYLVLAAAILLGFLGIAQLFDTQTLEDLVGITGTVLGIIVAILGIVIIAGAIGLKNYQEWGRILMIVISIISLLNFPIGTIIGVYGLIVLLKPATKALFNDTGNDSIA